MAKKKLKGSKERNFRLSMSKERDFFFARKHVPIEKVAGQLARSFERTESGSTGTIAQFNVKGKSTGYRVTVTPIGKLYLHRMPGRIRRPFTITDST